MRTFTIAAGLFGFAAIAMGGQGVLIKAPTRTFDAEYVYAPGTSEEAVRQLSVTRKFKFMFADASLTSDHTRMAPDDNANIREYLSQDVSEAIKAASQQALQEQVSVRKILPDYLKNLRFKTVDCRQVARQMVEHLVGNRIEVTKLGHGRESHRYQTREDQLDVALTAKQLDTISIMRDPSIQPSDNDPRFTCRETVVNGSVAKCGDLHLKYNPLIATSGAFKGEKAVVFNPDLCEKYDDMSFGACELTVQVQRCGLRYSEKAEGLRAGNDSTRGLADFLEANKGQEIRARENGTVAGPGAGDPASAAAATNTFYNQFKAPSDPGSRIPAE